MVTEKDLKRHRMFGWILYALVWVNILNVFLQGLFFFGTCVLPSVLFVIIALSILWWGSSVNDAARRRLK